MAPLFVGVVMTNLFLSVFLSFNIFAHNSKKLNYERFMLTRRDVINQAFPLHNYYHHNSVKMYNGRIMLRRNIDYVLSNISKQTWVTIFHNGPSSPVGCRRIMEGNIITVKGTVIHNQEDVWQ
jgi:hypothetical protein